MRALPFVLAGSLLAIGCGPRDRAIRLERLAAQKRDMELTLEKLEARLTATQARVRFWEEIRARHESVSAISCASLEEHAEEMARHALPEASSLHHARVASALSAHAAARAPAAATSRGAAVAARIRN